MLRQLAGFDDDDDDDVYFNNVLQSLAEAAKRAGEDAGRLRHEPGEVGGYSSKIGIL